MTQLTRYYLLIFHFWISYATAQNNKAESSFLIIKNINVVDVTTGKILPNQDVVLKNELIYFIGKSFSETVSSREIPIAPFSKYLKLIPALSAIALILFCS